VDEDGREVPQDASVAGFIVRGRIWVMRKLSLIRLLGTVPFFLLGWLFCVGTAHLTYEAQPIGTAIGLMLIAWGVFKLGMSLLPNQPPRDQK
jgi:hypothetical protein